MDESSRIKPRCLIECNRTYVVGNIWCHLSENKDTKISGSGAVSQNLLLYGNYQLTADFIENSSFHCCQEIHAPSRSQYCCSSGLAGKYVRENEHTRGHDVFLNCSALHRARPSFFFADDPTKLMKHTAYGR